MKLRDVASDFVGEFMGTYLLVFFGSGSVMVSVLYSAFSGLFQVAAIWGIGVTLAIYATRHLSCAHLNPAVSIAMVIAKRMRIAKLLPYFAGQFLFRYQWRGFAPQIALLNLHLAKPANYAAYGHRPNWQCLVKFRR